jgi:hypothetical protein
MVASPLESLSEIEKNHILDLKTGFHIESKTFFYLNPWIGIGFNYSQFGSRAKTTFVNVDYNQDGMAESGSLNSNFKLNFYAPSAKVLIPVIKDKLFGYIDGAMGVLTYQNEFSYLPERGDYKHYFHNNGRTLGIYSSIGAIYKLNGNLGFTGCLSELLGSYKKLEINGQPVELEDLENVSRLNLSVGIIVFL